MSEFEGLKDVILAQKAQNEVLHERIERLEEENDRLRGSLISVRDLALRIDPRFNPRTDATLARIDAELTPATSLATLQEQTFAGDTNEEEQQ